MACTSLYSLTSSGKQWPTSYNTSRTFVYPPTYGTSLDWTDPFDSEMKWTSSLASPSGR